MKRIAFVLHCLLALAFTALAQANQPDPREKEIKKVFELLDQSAVKRDDVGGAKLLHDEFTFVSPSGFVMNKERFVKSMLGGNNVFEEHNTQELSIRFFGNVAACQGLLKFRVNMNGQSRDFQARITVVIVKEKDQWQVFTYHSSQIPPPRPAQTPQTPQTPPPATKPPNEL